jgi:hypothetical protein
MSNQVETIINVQIENRDKTTVFLRGILVAPVLVFIATFTQSMHLGWSTGLIVLPTLLALVVRRIYPSYILSFNHSLMELQTRAFAYLFLLTDDYPSLERNPNVAVLLPDVDGGRKLTSLAASIPYWLCLLQ